jgi:transposase
MVAELAGEPSEVMVGIETDRGLLVGWLVAAGYRVYATNPFAVSRYRDRHATSGAKSDPGDAKVLADLVRTDRHNHREVAGGSELAEAVKVLARAHQSLVWTRQRQVNQLRSTLREFYPGALAALGDDLASHGSCSILGMAPTPDRGRQLTRSRIRRSLAAAGRTRNLDRRAEQLHGPCTLPSWRLRRSSPRPTGRWSARWWW